MFGEQLEDEFLITIVGSKPVTVKGVGMITDGEITFGTGICGGATSD